MATKTIPDKYLPLLTTKKAFAHLATLMPDGSPQVTPVWVDYKNGKILVNTARGRLKDKNMTKDARVALSVTDPDNPYTHLAVRGRVVKVTEEGADDSIDALAKKYLGQDKYPFRQPGEVRVIYEIEPIAVSGMGLPMLARALERAAGGTPLSDDEALALAGSPDDLRPAIREAARAARDRAFGRTVTFSPKVFLPLTNLCRNRCSYCSFRRSPGDAGEHTMTPEEVVGWVSRARAEGCAEALFCLGDKPEIAFSAYRRTLASLGQTSTVDYLHHAAKLALAADLLPHTNAGLLSAPEMLRLKEVNASLGLMLESASPRLCEPGMPHHKAPDKRPEKRLRMIDEAGQLKIPFTTGILVGIGETRRERVESLLAIRRLHRAHGHVQEVIVQNFRAVSGVPMEHAAEPDEDDMADAVAIARLVLDPDVSLQAPPNLSPEGASTLLSSGINDFGGISPVTPDYINPRHPWPHVGALSDTCAKEGFTLRPRAPIYERFVEKEGFLDPRLADRTRAVMARLAAVPHPSRLASAQPEKVAS